jgi:anti-sigma factor RsiW
MKCESMSMRSFKSGELHGTDQELLCLLDGELGRRDLTRVRGHLEGCEACQERLARIESRMQAALAEVASARTPAMDASGPHSQMKARLAELADGEEAGSTRGSWMGLGLARAVAFACALVLLAITGVVVLRQEAARHASVYSRLLPDPSFTPGATRAVALEDICKVDSDDVVRSVPAPLREKVFQEYGMANAPATEFEVDYLITPGLGGADDVRNLWPEPHANTLWNSYVKDQLEDRLHRMVCGREIPLAEAQREIAGNWIAAYKKYFHTDQPLGNLTGSVQLDVAARRKQRGS